MHGQRAGSTIHGRTCSILGAATLLAAIVGATAMGPTASLAAPRTAPGVATVPPSVEGAVTDGTSGLGAIDVRAYDATSGVAVAKTVTAADGTYALNGVPAGTYKVRFSDATEVWALQWFRDATTIAGATPIVVVAGETATADATLVENPTRLSGHVRASESGAPIADVAVRVSDAAAGTLAAKTRTDASGAYAFGHLPVGTYVIRFSLDSSDRRMQWYPRADRLADATPVVVAVGAPVVADASLIPAATIIAHVGGVADEPLAGIEMRAYDAPTGAFLGKAFTDAGGQAVLAGIGIGPHGRTDVKVRFSDPVAGHGMVWYNDGELPLISTLQLQAAQHAELTIRMPADWELGRLTGRVTDGTNGIAGVSVRVYPELTFNRLAKTYTAADGTYAIPPLFQGTNVRIQFGDEGGDWAPRWYADAPDPGGATLVTIAYDGDTVADMVLTPATHRSLTVDVATDAPDASPTDGLCDDGSGHCTLRAAVDEANANPSSDTITIAPGIDPILTLPGSAEDANAGGDLDSRSSLTIHGGGATVDASRLDRGIHQIIGALTIDHLTVTNGSTAGDAVPYGDDGGGILVSHGDLNLSDSAVTNSEAIRFQAGAGGGIAVFGSLKLVDSVVSGNTAESSGGGVFAVGASTTITRSTISGNQSHVRVPDIRGDESSAALNIGSLAGANGPVLITDSTISGNVSLLNDQGRSGGGTNIYASTATIRNTTIAGNSADVYPDLDDGGCCGSAGFAGTGGPMALIDDTITDNTGWPGVYQVLPAAGTGPFTMTGTILSGAVPVCNGAFISLGWNIWSDSSCLAPRPTDRSSTAALLGPLTTNGGPTMTRLPAASSPAVDAVPVGTPGLCDGTVATDQRGLPRPRGPACDIGAVER